MPAPTMDTLATCSLTSTDLNPMISRFSSISSLAAWASLRATVKLMSLLLSRPMDWRMMSTLMFFLASREKILKAMPG